MISTCNTAGAFFHLRGALREQQDSATLEEKYFSRGSVATAAG